jgi:hypothetical protein
MAQGSKAKYTSKQKRMARHIEEGQKKSGAGSKNAERIAWATVNKSFGKAGTNKIKNKSAMKKGGRKGGHRSHTHAA